MMALGLAPLLLVLTVVWNVLWTFPWLPGPQCRNLCVPRLRTKVVFRPGRLLKHPVCRLHTSTSELTHAPPLVMSPVWPTPPPQTMVLCRQNEIEVAGMSPTSLPRQRVVVPQLWPLYDLPRKPSPRTPPLCRLGALFYPLHRGVSKLRVKVAVFMNIRVVESRTPMPPTG